MDDQRQSSTTIVHLATANANPTPLRAVSRWEIVALSLNDVVGSGIYLLPATAFALLGAATLWGVLVAALCVFLVVLCFAEASSLFDRSGGAYVYTRAAFGDFIGFEVGWMTWVTRLTVAASLSAGFAQAVTGVWPGAAAGWGKIVTTALPVTLLTAINIVGVKHGARTSIALLVGKLTPLLFLLAIGLPAVDWARVAPAAAPPTDRLGEAALLLLFAFAGFENTSAPAGEFRNPRRDVPFALLLMIAAVTALYCLVHVVALGVVPDLVGRKTPLADAAGMLTGPFGIWLLTVGAGLSILGTCNNTTLSGGRYLYALAEGGTLPSFFASVHPRFRTPWIAILTQAAIALPLAMTGTFVQLAALSVIARMASYIGTAAALPVLRRKMPDAPRAVRLPGGPIIPIATLVLCIAVLSSATTKNLIAAGLALIIGAAIYVVGSWFRSRSTPVAVAIPLGSPRESG